MEKTAAARLDPLLGWTNVDRAAEDRRAAEDLDYRPAISPTEARRRLRAFVESFAADPVRGRVTKIDPREWRPWKADPASVRTKLSDDELVTQRLKELRTRLLWLLTGQGVSMQLPSLAFRVDRRQGRNTMLVSGEFPEVVLYLAAWLIAKDNVVVDTCHAPRAGDPGRSERDWPRWPECEGLFVAGGRGSGKHYCSKPCKRRAKNPNWKKRQKKEKR
jgi:hypothetical protein